MKTKNSKHLPKSVILEFLRRHSIRVRRTVVEGKRVWEARNPYGETFHAEGLQQLYWAYSRAAAGLPDDRRPIVKPPDPGQEGNQKIKALEIKRDSKTGQISEIIPLTEDIQ